MKRTAFGLGIGGLFVLVTGCSEHASLAPSSSSAGTNAGGSSGTSGSGSSGMSTGGSSGAAAEPPQAGATGLPDPTPMPVDVDVRGRVTDRSGEGIPGCRVVLGTVETLTAADGGFVLKGSAELPEPPATQLSVACRGYLSKPVLLQSFGQDLGTISLARPNILLLMTDDMAALTSEHKTPNLKALADSGVSFERAHAPAQECNPSRTSILLGQRPSSTGMYWNSHEFRQFPATKAAVTLPQFFENQGYETLDAGKIYHQRTETWSLSGPGGGVAVPQRYLSEPWHEHDFLAKGDTYNEEAFVFGPSDGPEEQIGDYTASKYIADYVTAPHDKPFFAAFGAVKPHTPLVVPQKYFDLYPLEQVTLPAVAANDLADVGPIATTVANNFGRNIHETVQKHGVWQQAVRAYNAAVSFVDSNMGMVLSALETGPHADNTIVIFVSDHGVHLGTKEHWWKMTLWNETTRIPFILRVPGVTAAGGVSPRTVNALDIYPTLLELLNYPADPSLDGRSIAPLLKDPQASWDYPTLTSAGYMNHSVVSERYRYSRYADGFEELYDEDADPSELRNLAGDPQLATVIADLAQWLPQLNVPDPLK